MKQITILVTTGILAVAAALAIVLLVEDPTPQVVNTIQQQPQREQYQAPVWVKQDGRDCIKQGTTVTCG